MGKIRPRKHDRVRHLREVKYRVASGAAALPGHTIDLSPTGVGLFCARSPVVGETIDLTWTDHDPAVTISGRVVYVKVEVEGSRAGVLFHHPVDPAVFKTLTGARRPRTSG